MIDTIFAVIEDIYFQVIDDSTPDSNDTTNKLNLTDATLSPLIEAFREKAMNTPYKGVSGNQFKLLKVAGYMLNYTMYGDDGAITSDEQELISKYIKSKLSKLSDDEKNELHCIFDERATLNVIVNYIKNNELPLRSIDMILDTLIDQIQDEHRYFLPLEALYKILIDRF